MADVAAKVLAERWGSKEYEGARKRVGRRARREQATSMMHPAEEKARERYQVRKWEDLVDSSGSEDIEDEGNEVTWEREWSQRMQKVRGGKRREIGEIGIQGRDRQDRAQEKESKGGKRMERTKEFTMTTGDSSEDEEGTIEEEYENWGERIVKETIVELDSASGGERISREEMQRRTAELEELERDLERRERDQQDGEKEEVDTEDEIWSQGGTDKRSFEEVETEDEDAEEVDSDESGGQMGWYESSTDEEDRKRDSKICWTRDSHGIWRRNRVVEEMEKREPGGRGNRGCCEESGHGRKGISDGDQEQLGDKGRGPQRQGRSDPHGG